MFHRSVYTCRNKHVAIGIQISSRFAVTDIVTVYAVDCQDAVFRSDNLIATIIIVALVATKISNEISTAGKA